ncbi:hypothetical protein [Mesorhizobium sp. M0571]|uniref:hypothetical protein n=1 Tax=Mesorhizobium sp. M0571 TaxID=2956960 RepID=UPI00333D8A95
MAKPIGLNAADFGADVSDLQNSAGNALFKTVQLDWSLPVDWEKGKKTPTDRSDACVYVIMHDDGRYRQKKRIVYVGLTKDPSKRFLNHPTAHDIVNRQGRASISFSFFDFIQGRNKIERVNEASEEVEHILIWTLWPYLENDRKMFTLPGMGVYGGNAWHILNKGYRFHGQMPREIVYPWMLVKPGRNRSAKT